MNCAYLGLAIKRCRLLRGMTANELADKAGIHRNTLSAYEGGREPDEKTFVKLCLHLEVEAGEVFAAACLAKLNFDLRPLEDQMKAGMGLPVREQERSAAEQHDELLSQYLTGLRNLKLFELAQSSPQSQQRELIRLSPESLRDLGSGTPRRARTRKRR